jgi:hypothetical protein
MSLNYDSDDAYPRSPGLRPIKPRATPTPSPPPTVTHQIRISTTQNVSSRSPSSRRRKKSNRRKTRPSQGDFVLIRIMDPNRPDIAREVGERALNSDSGSDMDDEEMDEPSPSAESTPVAHLQPRSTETPSLQLSKVAREALDASEATNNASQTPVFKAPALPIHRDSVVEPDSQERNHLNAFSTDALRAEAASIGAGANGLLSDSAEAKPPAANSATQTTSPLLTVERRGSMSNGKPYRQSAITSPHLLGLTIPPSSGADASRLPALQTPQTPTQDGSVSSPSQKHQLPSIAHINELAETAAQEQENTRAQLSHRQSISSMGASPTSVGRQLSITSLSPASAYPLSASPGGSAQDPFLRTGQQLAFLSTRRPSQASDIAPFSATIHSATTNDSYQSSDSLSPGSQHRLSIDSALTSRTLPLPVGPNIQHISPQVPGSFRCEYPGCNAAPFQTQYLLK